MSPVIAKSIKSPSKAAVTKTIAAKGPAKAVKPVEKAAPKITAKTNTEKTPVVRKDVMPAKPSREAAAPIATLEDVLARSGARDRTNVEKHLAACEAEPDPNHGQLWRKIASKIASLASMPIQTVGLQAVMFFIPDGKYRMQVFALEDKGELQIQLYLPDVLPQAIKNKIVAKVNGDEYTVVGSKDQTFTIQSLDASNTSDPPPHLKNMIGWNRKAIRVTLKTTESSGPRVTAAEAMIDLAAAKWAAK